MAEVSADNFASEHLRLMSMSRNLHKERFSCRLSIGSNFFAIRTAGGDSAVSWRCDQHVHVSLITFQKHTGNISQV